MERGETNKRSDAARGQRDGICGYRHALVVLRLFRREYSIAVWATGPTAYPVEDNGILLSANMDQQIVSRAEAWIEEPKNTTTLLPVLGTLAAVCLAIATGGSAVAVATAVILAVAPGSRFFLNPSGKSPSSRIQPSGADQFSTVTDAHATR